MRERGYVGVRERMRGCVREGAWVRERGCVGARERIRGNVDGDAQVVGKNKA